MFGLISGIVESGDDVIALQKRVVGQDFVEGRAGAEEFQDVGDTDTMTANARASAALTLFDRDSIKTLQIHRIALVLRYVVFGLEASPTVRRPCHFDLDHRLPDGRGSVSVCVGSLQFTSREH